MGKTCRLCNGTGSYVHAEQQPTVTAWGVPVMGMIKTRQTCPCAESKETWNARDVIPNLKRMGVYTEFDAEIKKEVE